MLDLHSGISYIVIDTFYVNNDNSLSPSHLFAYCVEGINDLGFCCFGRAL